MQIPRAVALLLTVSAMALAYACAVRPAYLNWGSTESERMRAFLGDDVVAGPHHQQTRAIAIAAPAATVWPWVAQLGQDRGGFYSYDVLENLVGCEMPAGEILRPDRQAWVVGDRLWMYPPHKAGGIGFATLRYYEPGRVLAFGTHVPGTPIDRPDDGLWTFVVEAVDASNSRLLVRSRATSVRSIWGAAFDHAIFEPVHFAMERRMMTGIKQLAEGQSRRRAANTAHVVIWSALFLLMLISLARTIFQGGWAIPLLLFAVSSAAFQFATLAQPSLPVSLMIVVALVAASVMSRPARQAAFGLRRR